MKDFTLTAFHLLGLIFRLMIVTQKVQKSMHNQMGEMIFERFAFFECFALNRFPCNDDVTKHWSRLLASLYRVSGKRQNIGRLVLVTPLGVDLPDGSIVGKNQTQFALSGFKPEIIPGRLNRALHKPFKDCFVRPIAGFDHDIDLDRVV